MIRATALALAAIVTVVAPVPAAVAQTQPPAGSASNAQAPSVAELVDRNITAKGGMERIKAVQTLKQTSTISMQGISAQMTLYAKRPNLTRQEVMVGDQTIVNAFDGQTPWVINPLQGITTPMAIEGPPAELIRDQSDFDGPLVRFKEEGLPIEYVGTEQLDGRTVHRLKLTSKSGQAQELYLDADTGLETRIVITTMVDTPTGPVEQKLIQDLSDFRQVDGITLPFRIRTFQGTTPQGEVRVQSVELNAPLDDALFKMSGGS